ncbi:helix-turn-helix transcriptional regulator [Desulfovibrio sp. X2]|uniref:helix-turn-helix transcriptional regulator n=1 Tax=Desulfovibrio sp. X2 TaxID=941449 RepID=UPI00155A2B9D|nr:helix-turn-helix transcriptional regulator [Desulfovibrio sp. X2]
MTTVRDLARKLDKALARPAEEGISSLPCVGAVCNLARSKLHNVSAACPIAVVILDGSKLLLHDGQSLTVPRGGMFLLPGGFEIAIENIPAPDSGRFLSLCLSLDESTLARLASAGRAAPAPAAFCLEALRVAVDEPLRLALGHLLDMAATCPAHDRLLSICLDEVLLLAAERTASLPFVWHAATTWAVRCARLVAVDPGRSWTALEMARRLGTSERTLRRMLAAEGTAVRTVLRTVRLNAALNLLQGGRTSVGEAAARCGYDSASRFAAVFREHFGASPSDVLRCNAVCGQ